MHNQNDDMELLEKLQSMPYHRMSPAVRSRLYKDIKENAGRFEKSHKRNTAIKRLAVGFVCCAALLLAFLTAFTPTGRQYAGGLWDRFTSPDENKNMTAALANNEGIDTLKNFINAYYTVNQSDYDYYEKMTKGAEPGELNDVTASYETVTKKFGQYLSQKSYENFYGTRLSYLRMDKAYKDNILVEVKDVKFSKYQEDKKENTIDYNFTLQLNYTGRDTKNSEIVTLSGSLAVINENGVWKIASNIGTPFPGTNCSLATTPTPNTSKGSSVFSDAEPASIKMIDENFGWAAGNKQIIRTADGGFTWTDATPSGSHGRIIGSYFLDANNGWVATTKDESSEYGIFNIYRTSDGGKSWKKAVSPVEGVDAVINFTDDKQGVILVAQDAGAGSEAVALLKTKDGGASWSVASTTGSGTGKAGDIPFGGQKYGAVFRDTNNGYIAGFSPADGHAYLYVTNDGGKTWQDANLKVPSEYKNSQISLMSPEFFTDQDGIMAVNSGSEDRSIFFYATHDGGKTWSFSPSLIPVGKRELKWSFIDAQTIAASEGKKIYTSSDGGNTWASITPNISMDEITAMDFVSKDTGYIISGKLLYITKDGGNTWSRTGASR